MRLRMKVFEENGKLWMVNAAFQNLPDRKLTVMLSGEHDVNLTRTMTIDEYNALGYHWFQDTGEAPHGTAIHPVIISGT